MPEADAIPVNTRFILCVGMILVVNSHLKDYYPHPAFGGDGLLGFAIFFFAAGLGIALSFRRQIRPFGEYYFRRVMRIYPTLWLVLVPVTLIDWYGADRGFSDYFAELIFPTSTTFVRPLLIAYIPLYFLLRTRRPGWLLVTIALLLIPDAIFWAQLWPLGKEAPHNETGSWLWLCLNSQIMFLGAYLGARPAPRIAGIGRDLLASLGVLAAYIALKTLFSTEHFKMLFIALFLVIAVQCWLLFRVAHAPALARAIERWTPLRWAVLVIGGCSLELYFIHFHVVVLHWSDHLARLPFPLGIVAVWAISLPLSILAERIAAWMRSGFRTFSWKIGAGVG